MEKKYNGMSIGIILILILTLPGLKPASTLALPTPNFIVIGCTLPLTGRFAGNGVEVKDGYEVGVNQINQAGGIFVKEFRKKIPLQLLLYDDESDPTKAAARYEKLCTENKVVAYLGSFSTVINVSLIAVAEKNKVPIVVSHFGNLAPHRQGYKYLFSPFQKTEPDHPKIFDALADIFGKDRAMRVAIIVSRTEQPMEMAKAYRDRIAAEGRHKVVVDESYALGTKDFSMIITKAKAADAEVWLSHVTPPEGMALVRQMKELNYIPKFVNMVQASSSREWPGGSKEMGEYVSALECWIPGLPWPGNDKFIEDVKKRTGDKLPWSDCGTGYIDVQVLANAIERAGTLDREKIRDALAKTDMMTVGGPVKVRPDGTFELLLYLCQWQKGKFVPVWPKKYAFADPIYPIPKWSER